MKIHAVILSLVLAASAATTVQAASHKHHRKAMAATASKTDWPGNPYMDLKPSQVSAFWRDAFNPAGVK